MKKIVINNSNELSFEEAFKRFISFKEINNLSPQSIVYYKDCAKFFTGYFNSSNPCNMIDIDTIYGYIAFLRKENPDLKDVTINSYLRGLRVILYYFMELGYMREFKIKLIKADKRIKETYTQEELKLLLKKPDIKTCSFSEYRTWVMTNCFLATGIRLSTATELKINDIRFDTNEIFLRKVKNRSQQIVPLSQSLSKVLREYLQYRQGNGEDYLFCNQYGQKLASSAVQSCLQRYNRKRGVYKTSAHLYRHTFAKNWILNGGDIFRLQRLLGHSTMDMVRQYVNMFNDELQIQYNEFNPLDNFLKENQERTTKIKMRK